MKLRSLLCASAALAVLCTTSIAAEPAKPRQDGCIGQGCGKDKPLKSPQPRKDGCTGVNCGPDKKSK